MPWGGGRLEQREKTKWLLRKSHLPIDLLPRRSDPDVTVRGAARERVASPLVARGYLPKEARGDPAAIGVVIEVVLSDLELELEQERF